MRVVLAVILAFVTASLYALSTSLQAMEARRSPRASALRASLVEGLVRRPLWLAGTAAGIVAWPLQAAALALGSVALVQPALGFGLVVLLVLGVTVLHERVGRAEVAGVVAIGAAVAVLGWAAPGDTGGFTHAGEWAVALLLGVVAAGPHLLRAVRRADGLTTSVAAGIGWAAVGLGTSLLDTAVGDRHWLVALGWGVAVAAAAWGALLSEMTSLQTWPATRAIPVAFGLEMLLPAVLAPLLTNTAPPHTVAFAAALTVAAAGAVILGRSPAVARAAVAS
jgi:drug/metabolite transporter (DMT)-like permease